MKKYNFSLSVVFTLFIQLSLAGAAVAQSTFSQVYQILQSNCGNSGCHGAINSQSFSVSGSESDVYNAIVGKDVSNLTAKAKKNKIVSPGDVQRSFLLRKIAHGISAGLELDATEGSAMPKDNPKLDDEKIELVRQWILYGAPETGEVASASLVNQYYQVGGLDVTYGGIKNAPNPGEGLQVYIGRVFIGPNEEKEYFLKYNTHIDVNTEVHQVETLLPAETHHFIIYNFLPGQSGTYKSGLREISLDSHGQAEFGYTTGPGRWEYDLPDGTAYFWPKDLVLDINLHISNNNTSIIACDLYMNIYTQPQGTAENYMFSRNFPNYDIPVPHDSNEYSFEVAAVDPNATHMWNVWKMTTHTHRYGTDYDVWLRNPDGTKGQQVYEGFVRYEDGGFNQGFYGWGPDVTIRTFEGPFLEVNPHHGFIHRAKFINTAGPDTVNWGLTSLDEMMVLSFQYFKGAPLTTGISSANPNIDFSIYPNPSAGSFILSHHALKAGHAKVELLNAIGELIATPLQEFWNAGTNTVNINSDRKLPPGMYFVKLSFDDAYTIQKIISTP